MNDAAPTAPTSPLPPAPGALSPPAAILGTFSKPSETFGRLLAHPTWWLPLVLGVLATVGILLVTTPKIDMERTIREAMEKRAAKTGQTVSPELVTRQADAVKKMQPVFLGVGLVVSVLAFFVVGLVLWGGARAMGADARYAQLLAIWAHASLPNLVAALVAIPVFATVADGSLSQAQAQSLVASNAGAFLAESAPAALRSLLGSLDVFSPATLFLLVPGFRKLPGLSKGAATATPIALWVIWVVGKTSWAAVFG
ncbi:MAG TPA: YIP1 family protein [Thermoanaerobaculia bacterium]|nr:YIP1 family protein [Thermoanaerobaculia bacterium]